MAALNILYNKSAQELKDSARRLCNDVNPDSPAIPEYVATELLIALFVFTMHELGPDPRSITRPTTGVSIQTYTLHAGEYQTTLEGESDVVASDQVTIDRALMPLCFLPRAEMENLYNSDLKLKGAVTRGIPLWWSMKIEQKSDGTSYQMMHSMLCYPACDADTVFNWPRTLVDTENVDPSGAGRMAVSYQVTFALELRLAAAMTRMMSAEALSRLAIDRGLADGFERDAEAALEREREERSHHYLADEVRQIQS